MPKGLNKGLGPKDVYLKAEASESETAETTNSSDLDDYFHLLGDEAKTKEKSSAKKLKAKGIKKRKKTVVRDKEYFAAAARKSRNKRREEEDEVRQSNESLEDEIERLKNKAMMLADELEYWKILTATGSGDKIDESHLIQHKILKSEVMLHRTLFERFDCFFKDAEQQSYKSFIKIAFAECDVSLRQDTKLLLGLQSSQAWSEFEIDRSIIEGSPLEHCTVTQARINSDKFYFKQEIKNMPFTYQELTSLMQFIQKSNRREEFARELRNLKRNQLRKNIEIEVKDIPVPEGCEHPSLDLQLFVYKEASGDHQLESEAILVKRWWMHDPDIDVDSFVFITGALPTSVREHAKIYGFQNRNAEWLNPMIQLHQMRPNGNGGCDAIMIQRLEHFAEMKQHLTLSCFFKSTSEMDNFGEKEFAEYNLRRSVLSLQKMLEIKKELDSFIEK